MSATAIDPQSHASLKYRAGQFSSPVADNAVDCISVFGCVVDRTQAALQRMLDV